MSASSAAPGSPVAARPRRFRLLSKAALLRLAILAGLIFAFLAHTWWAMIVMPGSSYAGPLPAATDEEREVASRSLKHVTVLAKEIAQRSTWSREKFARCGLYLKDELTSYGYTVREHSYTHRGAPCPNFEAELTGHTHPSEIIVLGAHYDSYQGTPGADDNASGVAAVLELARLFAGKPMARTVRFVLFVNEEPPAFQTPDMGSWVYAKACKAANDNIILMVSLEAIGYYDDKPGSQKYPPPFAGVLGAVYPDRGDFITFVGHYQHRGALKQAIGAFRETTSFPSEGAAVGGLVPFAGFSDHWSFWQEGYPAIMVTDTAPMRNPNYHIPQDLPHTLDYDRMSRVIVGMKRVTEKLAE